MKRVLDYIIYVSIGLVVVALIYWSTSTSIGENNGIVRWGGLVGDTVLLVCYRGRPRRHLGVKTRYWIVFGTFLAVRTALLISALLIYPGWRAFHFIILFPLELLVMNLLLIRFGLAASSAADRHRLQSGNSTQCTSDSDG